jgi:hypothetical protein
VRFFSPLGGETLSRARNAAASATSPLFGRPYGTAAGWSAATDLQDRAHHTTSGSTRVERAMPEAKKARTVGFNHIAIEVGDIDEALEFYGRCSTSSCAARAKTRLSSI